MAFAQLATHAPSTVRARNRSYTQLVLGWTTVRCPSPAGSGTTPLGMGTPFSWVSPEPHVLVSATSVSVVFAAAPKTATVHCRSDTTRLIPLSREMAAGEPGSTDQPVTVERSGPVVNSVVGSNETGPGFVVGFVVGDVVGGGEGVVVGDDVVEVGVVVRVAVEVVWGGFGGLAA